MNVGELFDLTGKVAIVTGAARGLGKAMALGLAQAGANIAAVDLLDVSGTVEEIRRLGREAVGIKADVSKKAEVEGMVQEVLKKFGRIDILVNNAGIVVASPAEEMSENDWDRVINVNLKGVFLCSQAVGRHMIKQRSGKIINIASVAGLRAPPQTAAYNASKAGVILLTKTLAAEWGKYNIQVNAISPGVFETEMTKPLSSDKSLMQAWLPRIPLGKFGKPEDLVGTVIYLASKASDYVTGQVIIVDGGLTALL